MASLAGACVTAFAVTELAGVHHKVAHFGDGNAATRAILAITLAAGFHAFAIGEFAATEIHYGGFYFSRPTELCILFPSCS